MLDGRGQGGIYTRAEGSLESRLISTTTPAIILRQVMTMLLA